MAISFDERLDMLQQASRAWLELKRVVDRLSDADLNRPNTVGSWSGKDLLAHIANWEEVGIEVIQGMEAGEPERWPDEDDDTINTEMLEPYRSMSLADVRRYFEQTHYALMDLAERSQAITPNVLLSVTAEHYAEHLEDFRRLSRRK